MTPPHSSSSLRTRIASDKPVKSTPRFQLVTEAQRRTDPEVDPAYDNASFTRREAIAGHSLMGAHGLMRHGMRLAAAAFSIALLGLLIGFHAWQDHRARAAAANGGSDLVVVETVSDSATTLLLAGTLAKLVGVPRDAMMQRLDARAASAVAVPPTVGATAKPEQPVWLARTMASVAALPATLSPSRLIDPITQAVRAHVQQGLRLVGIADDVATVSGILQRFQYTMERTLPDALERATPRR